VNRVLDALVAGERRNAVAVEIRAQAPIDAADGDANVFHASSSRRSDSAQAAEKSIS
jgi:hypothetical protein